MKTGRREGIAPWAWPVMMVIVLAVGILCVGIGSEYLDPGRIAQTLWNGIRGLPAPDPVAESIVLKLRLPRVLCAAMIGAALSLCGAAMQGLLRNPLADGSILGVSAGGSLGAALAIVGGITIPWLPLDGSGGMAVLFSFGSLMIVLSMAYGLDRSLSSYTVILTGVIFSMLASALLSLLMTFSGDKLKFITHWTMGSLSGRRMNHVLVLSVALAVLGGILLRYARELNHFALGEENARRLGVPVRRVKAMILVVSSALIGICVAVGGNIAFVGLIVPHMVRMITGPNHRKVMPMSVFAGAVFLMLTDLLARTVIPKGELPIGVVTSLIGAVTFAGIFRSSRKGGKRRAER